MYILIVDYIKTSHEVEPFSTAHQQWVKQQFVEQNFYAAGPKTNKLGGIIFAKTMDKNKLQAIIATDPYVVEDVAEYRVIEFSCKAAIAELQYLQTV